jgi:hypothetical protein
VANTDTEPQLSVAVGMAHCAAAQLPDVVKAILGGQDEKTGLMVSLAHGFWTLMTNEQVARLFIESVAV